MLSPKRPRRIPTTSSAAARRWRDDDEESARALNTPPPPSKKKNSTRSANSTAPTTTSDEAAAAARGWDEHGDAERGGSHSRRRFVPDEEETDDDAALQQQPQHVIRPIAMRPRDAEALYEQACTSTSTTGGGLEWTLPRVHQAVQASYAWHRHWTTEAGRREQEEEPQLPLPPMDRCRNPSPRDGSISSSTSSSSPIIVDQDDAKAQRVVHKRGRGDGATSLLAQNLGIPPDTTTTRSTTEPLLLRPQAMRIAVRPECVQVPHLVQDDDDDDNDNRPSHSPLQPSQLTIFVPRTSGGTEDAEESSRRRSPPCRHFQISNAATTERSISPLTVDADLFQDEDILQTVHASEAPVHIVQDDDENDDEPSVLTMTVMTMDQDSSKFRCPPPFAAEARERILQELAVTAGETTSEGFQSALQILQASASQQQQPQPSHTGMWLTLTKPTFFDCLGVNGNGDPLYTLGRMSFGLCAPTQLVCSLQGNFNRMERVEATTGAVPKSLRQELLRDCGHLETYDIITAFTIEPHSPAFPHDSPNRDVTRPIRGIMTTYGYIIPDPLTPNRYTVWITGGRLEPDSTPDNITAWQTLFAAHPPQHTLTEHAKLWAVQWLMGATLPRVVDATTGAMEYTFERPLGGHGVTYLDNLYTDPSLRIWRGHRGTTFVLARTAR